MDVLLDTNALRAAGLASPAMKALAQYLERTGSSLLVPDVVLEELLAQRRAALRKVERDLDAAHRDLVRLGGPETKPPQIDHAQALDQYRAEIMSLASRVTVCRNTADDLPELVRRLANRVPPASAEGEEARDVIIWLVAAKHAGASALALVSADKAFVAPSGLREELRLELGAAAARLVVHRSVDEFLGKHLARVTSIDESWVEAHLPEAEFLEEVGEYLYEHRPVLHNAVVEFGEPTGYASPVRLISLEVQAATVADLPNSNMYVGASVVAYLEIDVEYHERVLDEDDYWYGELGTAYSHHIEVELLIEVQLQVADDEVSKVSVASARLIWPFHAVPANKALHPTPTSVAGAPSAGAGERQAR